MKNELHLRPQDKERLLALLSLYLPDVEVWAYGSRVNGRSHEGSDLDLVLRNVDLLPIDRLKIMEFEDAIRESNIPILIEARDWARLPDYFHREIAENYVVIQSIQSGKCSR